MNITGEQIKEGRERLHLTQQELATQVGVSMRTVGNWERGESVPRSRMGAIREVLRMEGPADGRMELARLIQEEMDTSRRGPAEIVAGWPAGATRGFYNWRDGSAAPLRKSRGMLEDALGWRAGVVTEILEAPITREFTLSEVRDWGKLPEPRMGKAELMSNAELGTEVIARLDALEKDNERLRAELARFRNSDVTALHGEQHHFDLAASDEHVPGEDDRD